MSVLLVALWLSLGQGIEITMQKQNIFVKNNSSYEYRLSVNETDNTLNPFSNVVLNHSITNALTTKGQYFDYFSYISPADLTCYENAVNNKSYLFPCSFIVNNYQNVRTSFGQESIDFETFRGLNSNNYNFVVDNTPFPFPEGAYPYSDIYISASTYLNVQIQNYYTLLGIRLIFINLTVILIYTTVVLALVYRIRKINALMRQKEGDAEELKQRVSEISRDMDEESDGDNYEEIIHNEFSMRESKDARMPSLITSSQPSPPASVRREF